jgi:hypothetical protein
VFHSYARQFLMRSLAIRRKNVAKLEERVKAGICILDGCGCAVESRGLCEKHRQKWYRTLRKLATDDEKIRFEENSIRLGLILPNGEQDLWVKANPFEKAMVS